MPDDPNRPSDPPAPPTEPASEMAPERDPERTPVPTPDPAPAAEPIDPVTGEIHPEALIPREVHPSEPALPAAGEEEGSGEESDPGERGLKELEPGGRRKLWISLAVLAAAAVVVAVFVHFAERSAYDPVRFEELLQAFDTRANAALQGQGRYRIPSLSGLDSEQGYLNDLTSLLEENSHDCVGSEVAVRERWRSYAKERERSVLADAAESTEAGPDQSAAPDQPSDSAVLEQGSSDHQDLVRQLSAQLAKLLAAVRAFRAACPAEAGVLTEALGYPWAP